ncbi:MAG: MlaD family protein [Aeromicrobium sp.]|uniref:MCE family protein n=1 Tax=Aeromicrobium sp. TaxID=1871063 RepID=UPI0039E37CB2
MITRLTKMQLIAFVIVTVVGASFVGARYAEIDRLFVDRTYPVTVELKESGGIFAGAEVTYRGIAVGTVDELEFTDDGVEATLKIEKSAPEIPENAHALVANKSAIGEQYLDLRPTGSKGPYLKAGSKIPESRTEVPIDTTELLLDVNGLVGSVPSDDLHTVVTELGTAFDGTGESLTQILDSTAVVIGAAQANIDVTRALIDSSSTVLQTQVDKGSEIQSFSKNLALFTDTLVASDGDLRALLDQGTPAAATVNAVVAENAADLTGVLNNLTGPVKILDENVAGLQALYILYPVLVQGSYTVITPTGDGEFNAAFGNVLSSPVAVPGLPLPGTVEICQDEGHREVRLPTEISDHDANGEIFQTGLGCVTDGLSPRGSTNTSLSRTAVPGEGPDVAQLLLGTQR